MFLEAEWRLDHFGVSGTVLGAEHWTLPRHKSGLSFYFKSLMALDRTGRFGEI